MFTYRGKCSHSHIITSLWMQLLLGSLLFFLLLLFRIVWRNCAPSPCPTPTQGCFPCSRWRWRTLIISFPIFFLGHKATWSALPFCSSEQPQKPALVSLLELFHLLLHMAMVTWLLLWGWNLFCYSVTESMWPWQGSPPFLNDKWDDSPRVALFQTSFGWWSTEGNAFHILPNFPLHSALISLSFTKLTILGHLLS